jgi:hypothetical protein
MARKIVISKIETPFRVSEKETCLDQTKGVPIAIGTPFCFYSHIPLPMRHRESPFGRGN